MDNEFEARAIVEAAGREYERAEYDKVRYAIVGAVQSGRTEASIETKFKFTTGYFEALKHQGINAWTTADGKIKLDFADAVWTDGSW